MSKRMKKRKAQIDTKRFAPKVRKRQQYPRADTGEVQLLLTADVGGLGRTGEIVSVSPGYARNCLLPQGLATFANPHNIRLVELHSERSKLAEHQRIVELETLAQKLEQTSCTIQAKANEEGHLFGSVGGLEILRQLVEEGVDLDPDTVSVESADPDHPLPFKELGVYSVDVLLSSGIKANMKVWVVQD